MIFKNFLYFLYDNKMISQFGIKILFCCIFIKYLLFLNLIDCIKVYEINSVFSKFENNKKHKQNEMKIRREIDWPLISFITQILQVDIHLPPYYRTSIAGLKYITIFIKIEVYIF